MTSGRAQIIPDGTNTFSMVWAINGEIQPNGVNGKAFASVNAAMDAVKPLAGALPGSIFQTSLYFRNSIQRGQAQMVKEIDGQWSVTWLVDGLKSGSTQENLSLAAAIDAVKTLKDGLSGTFQWANILVRSA